MKWDLNALLENRKVVMALCVLFAVGMWYTVVLSVNTAYEDTVHNVPVSLDATNSTAGKPDIKPLISEDSPLYVSVTVAGKRSVIGNMEPEDLYITAPIGDIMAAGEYDLTLRGTDVHSKGVDIVSINPGVQKVRFDVWIPMALDITPSLIGLEIPDDYMMDNVVLSFDTVELTGPESMLSRIASCVVELAFDSSMTEPYSATVPLTFLDENGEALPAFDPNFVRINALGGAELPIPSEVTLTLPILKKKTLPTAVAFTNTPAGFDTDSLGAVFSEPSLALAGPEGTIDPMEEFVLGSVDLRELEPGTELELPVALPVGFKNLYEVETVRVGFALEGYTTKSLVITRLEAVNVPEGRTATVDTRQIRAEIVGPASVLAGLTAEDWVAEIDMGASDLVNGQATVPAKIRAPGQDTVWALGRDYSAVVTLRPSGGA